MAVFPLSVKFMKWSNTLKQFVGKLPTNCLSVFDHFVGLALKGLIIIKKKMKMKTRSDEYNINRPRSRHGHKYSIYKNSLSIW